MPQPELTKNSMVLREKEKTESIADVGVKELPASEQTSEYERDEYLVKDYAHDVTVKVRWPVHGLCALQLMAYYPCAGLVHTG